MNKFLLFNKTLIVIAFILTTCSRPQKEKISSAYHESAEASFAPELPKILDESSPKKKVEILKNEPAKSRKSLPTTHSSRKSTAKRIPFSELLKANISFTENKGQLERFENFYFPSLGRVKYYSKAFCGTAYFGNKGIGFGFQRGGLRDADFNANGTPKEKLTKSERKEMIGFSFEFKGGNESAEMIGINEQHTKINYLKGNNLNLHLKDISSYEKILYKKIYKGIDLLYYNKENQLKYDYILAPKADVKQIQMHYNNVNDLVLNEDGELEIMIDWGILVDKKPYAFQIIKGSKKEVAVNYVLREDKTIGFEIKGKYDPTKELIIDPFTVAWSTYVGTGTTEDGYVEATCIDNTGRVLGTGWTNNAFPINASANGYDKSYNGGTDAYVFRLDANGTSLDYVTFLGGSNNEVGTGILINSAGEICVSGHTQSYGSYSFVENSSSTLTVGTGTINVAVAGIGSYGFGAEIILTNGSNTLDGVITGFADATTLIVNVTNTTGSGTYGTWAISKVIQIPFPTTSGAIQSSKTGNDANDDLFYVKLNGAGNNITYGTYYGGSTSLVDWAIDLALDVNDNAYIVGRTESNVGFSTSTVPGIYKSAYQGAYDGYVLKIKSNGTLGYCTYIGGTGNDMAKGVDVTSSGEVFVTGMTASSGQGTSGVFQPNIGGLDDAFLLRLTSAGGISFFTYLGGSSSECGSDIDIIPGINEPVIVGASTSSDFPLKNAIDNTNVGGDGFVTRFTSNGTSTRYSTYIGGDGADGSKGFDYTTIHKLAGVKISTNKQPVLVYGMASSAASMSTFLVSPSIFTAVNQSGINYSFDGSTYSGGALGDFFLTVLDSTAQNVLYGSYFGGSENDYPTAGINILQSSGCVVMAGGVHSLPFPITPGVFLTTRDNSTTPDQPAVVKVCLTSILPIILLNFDIHEEGNGILLQWGTFTEKNNDHFEVLKSTDGISFYSIGRLEGHGTIGIKSNYSFLDKAKTLGKSYYKIQQVDYNGESTFSVTKSINIQNLTFISVSPNPGNGLLNIQSILSVEAEVQVSVRNVWGELLYQSVELAPKGTFEKVIQLDNMASGIYLIQITSGNDTQLVKYIKN